VLSLQRLGFIYTLRIRTRDMKENRKLFREKYGYDEERIR